MAPAARPPPPIIPEGSARRRPGGLVHAAEGRTAPVQGPLLEWPLGPEPWSQMRAPHGRLRVFKAMMQSAERSRSWGSEETGLLAEAGSGEHFGQEGPEPQGWL